MTCAFMFLKCSLVVNGRQGSPTLESNRFSLHHIYLFVLGLQADVSWSVNGIPKGIIKQSLGQVPIMVKSKLCNLHGLSPKELIEHHEEAEVGLDLIPVHTYHI